MTIIYACGILGWGFVATVLAALSAPRLMSRRH